MSKKLFVFTLVLAVSLAFAYAGIVQQKADDTATDPVCGMTVKKSEAKVTFDHEGKTYYFCSAGCKEAFAKDPEKYLAKAEQKPTQPVAMGMHRHAGMMTHGRMSGSSQANAMECPLHAKDVEMKAENLPDGVALKFTSKDPQTVKKIQEHVAEMNGGCPGCGACQHQEQIKK
jgi:YHS domain-containing protein/TusA-related sulfurtransferase